MEPLVTPPVRPMPGDAAAAVESTPVPTSRPVGAGFILGYAAALFGVWMMIMTPATVSLALRVAQLDPEGAASAYSIIAGVGALFAIVANPLFGRLSDRTTSRFGMRKPWMIVGVAGGLLSSVVLATAPSVPVVFLGWALMQVFGNAAVAALIAIIADQVPDRQRGLLSGIAGMTPVAAILVGTYFVQLVPDNTMIVFVVPALFAVVGVAWFVLVLRDRRLDARARPAFGMKEFLGTFGVSPRKAPAFSWFLLSMLLIAGALAVIQTYLYFVVADHLGVPEDEAPTVVFYLVLVMNVVSLIVSLAAGALSDRIGRRRTIFAVAGAFLAAGALVMVLAPSVPFAAVGVGLAGVGYGIFSGLYIAIATSAMHDPATTARDLGVVNIAYTLPYSLIPLAAPLILAIGGGADNYTALFAVAAVLALAGIPVLRKVQGR